MHKITVGLMFLAAGCLTSWPAASVASGQADTVFAQLADEYLAGYLAWRPQAGTALGFHNFDGKITDFGPRSLAGELARLKSFERRLAQVETNQLSQRSFFDYRLLRGAIQRDIFNFEDLEIYTQNPMTYAGALDLNIYIKRNFASLEDRARAVIAILKQAPNIMSAARINLRESLPRPLIETALEVAAGAADFLAKDLAEALQPVKEPGLLAEFATANQQAVHEMQQFVTYLREEKLPKASDHYALGREKYTRLLWYGDLVSLSPEQLLEIGMRELRREQEVFAQTARRIDPGKPPIEVFKAMQKDHPTEQNLIADTSRHLEMIRQFVIDHQIVTLPSPVRAQVAETPQFLRATSFASMDTPGPFETKATEAYYYVTPVEKDWPPNQKEEWLTAFNYYTTDVVSIHEAYPGHYVQFLCLNASSANKLEKIFGSYAFIEGWAHYAEQMMVDEGFGAGSALEPALTASLRAARYRLAQSDEALLRLCRFCVSVRMHCQGMTVEEAARFFQENCYYEPKPARQEAIRGAFDPEYLYYTLGKLEILKLRADYHQQEGSAFTLQRFHDELLRHGAPPVRLLREVMLKDEKTWSLVF